MAVLGDASYSMDVAIRASTIVASLLAALSQAELRFFNTSSHAPAVTPRTALECLHVATSTRADLQTAPAAALWEYYSQRKEVKCFVVVTDERKNAPAHGMYFHHMFYKYVTEVRPATCPGNRSSHHVAGVSGPPGAAVVPGARAEGADVRGPHSAGHCAAAVPLRCQAA